MLYEHIPAKLIVVVLFGAVNSGAMWELVTDPQSRELVRWLGGGLVTVAVGAWAVFKYFHRPSDTGNQPSTVEANHGIAAGRDVNARDVTFASPDKPAKRKR